jgi:hypothetical protein
MNRLKSIWRVRDMLNRNELINLRVALSEKQNKSMFDEQLLVKLQKLINEPLMAYRVKKINYDGKAEYDRYFASKKNAIKKFRELNHEKDIYGEIHDIKGNVHQIAKSYDIFIEEIVIRQ